MPAISVTQRWSGLRFDKSTWAWTGAITFDVAYAATAKDASDAVYTFAGFSTDQNNPSTYPGVPLMYLMGVTPEQDGIGHYIVTANYSTSPLGIVPNPTDPLNTAEEYIFDIGGEEVAVDQDAYGGSIINSVGAPLVGATRNFSVLSLIIERNEAIYNPAVALQYVDGVNKVQMQFSNLFTVLPGIAMLRTYKPVTNSTTKSPYVRCRYQFDMKRPVGATIDSDGLWDSWKHRELNKSRIGWYTDSNGAKKRGYFGRGVGFNDFVETSEDIAISLTGLPIAMPGETSEWKIRDFTNGSLASPVAVPSSLNTKVGVDTDPLTKCVFLKFCKHPPIDFGGLNL